MFCTLHECLIEHFGIHNKLLSWLSCEEIQSTILCTRRQTAGRNWLFWNVGSYCPMVDSANCYDSGNKTEASLRPMQHNSCIHPWMGHWNHVCPSTQRVQSWEVRWSPCLKCTLYNLKLSLWYFFHYLTERLIKQGLMASQFYPCLFISKLLIVIV